MKNYFKYKTIYEKTPAIEMKVISLALQNKTR